MNKSKTVLEWFNELPEPYRTQAIENTDKDLLDTTNKTAKDALKKCFTWIRTKQGFDYWYNFYKTL